MKVKYVGAYVGSIPGIKTLFKPGNEYDLPETVAMQLLNNPQFKKVKTKPKLIVPGGE